MRKIILLTLLSFVAVAAEPTVAVKEQADQMTRAVVAKDYESFASFLPANVVEAMGGKREFLKELKRADADMTAKKMAISDASVGDPQPPRKVGRWLVTFIPQHVAVDSPEMIVSQDTQLLAISENSGKDWKFIDARQMSAEEFRTVFPQFAGKIELPAKSDPVVKMKPR